MSKTKTPNDRDNRRDIELPPNVQNAAPVEDHEQTGAEKLLLASQPYWSHIALGLLICILGWVIVSYLAQTSREAAAEPSRQLADAMQQFNVTSNVDSLKQMKTDFPNEVATNWALLVAGDYELNRGLSQCATDREGAMKLIQRAKESFQSIVDSPSAAKTTMQQRRSLYSLAYTNESLGEFDAAKALYQQLLEEAPGSIFETSAKRGLQRVTDPDFVKLYQQFASYEPATEEAPGAAVPDAPDIDFPAIDLPQEESVQDDGSSFSPDTGGDAGSKSKPDQDKAVTQPTTDFKPTEPKPAGSAEATQGDETEATEVEQQNAETEVDSAVEAVVEPAKDAAEKTVESASEGVKSAVDAVKETVK